ncbi:hypothetical protein MTO96_019904 [Rhipicephalus appendiculatus]
MGHVGLVRAAACRKRVSRCYGSERSTTAARVEARALDAANKGCHGLSKYFSQIKDMIQFICNYIRNDSIGILCNAHPIEDVIQCICNYIKNDSIGVQMHAWPGLIASDKNQRHHTVHMQLHQE